jgi:hypothetical protein
MSSGVSSGQSSGVGNSQLSTENYEYAAKLAELQAEIFTSNLTDPQKSTLNTVVNTVTQHLTKMDYSGVERDIAGNPVPNGKGGFFDHIHEMKDSYKSLTKAKRSLEGSLKNPNLGNYEKSLLETVFKATNEHIQRIDKLFEPYGGIEKWKKK